MSDFNFDDKKKPLSFTEKIINSVFEFEDDNAGIGDILKAKALEIKQNAPANLAKKLASDAKAILDIKKDYPNLPDDFMDALVRTAGTISKKS